MTVLEFSDQFDVLYNNVTSNQAPGLSEYEKSVFLTKAQSQLVTEYFNNRIDGVGGGFDGSQKRQYDFSSLIKVATLVEVGQTALSTMKKLDKRSKVYAFPSDYFLSVNEILSDSKYQYSVQPLDYSEYLRLMMKPYNYPVKRGAWRLITNSSYFVSPYGEIEVPSYIKSFDTTTGTYSEVAANGEYSVYSDWISTKEKSIVEIKNLNVSPNTPLDPTEYYTFATINRDFNGTIVHPSLVLGDTFVLFRDVYNGVFDWRELECYSSYDAASGAYKISISLKPSSSEIDINSTLDDTQVLDIIRDAFSLVEEFKKIQPEYCASNSNYLSLQAAEKSDGFKYIKAPADFIGFRHQENGNTVGLSIMVSTSKTSFVEIIGKFTGAVEYQMRYVRKLSPIITADLATEIGTGVTIEGKDSVSECMLPVECHQEILERAVTLAKIAWAGGTSTQAAAAQREK